MCDTAKTSRQLGLFKLFTTDHLPHKMDLAILLPIIASNYKQLSCATILLCLFCSWYLCNIFTAIICKNTVQLDLNIGLNTTEFLWQK